MAVTTQYSTEYDAAYVTADRQLESNEMHGRVRCAKITCAQDGAGDATSSFAVVKLPPGKVRLLAGCSRVYVNWTTASATLDFGWDAYVDPDGTAVAADTDGVDNGVNVDTAGFIQLGSALTTTGGDKVFNSRDGVVLRITSQDTAIADADTVAGNLFYVMD